MYQNELAWFSRISDSRAIVRVVRKEGGEDGGGTAEGNNRDDAIMKEISKRDRDVGKIERRKQ